MNTIDYYNQNAERFFQDTIGIAATLDATKEILDVKESGTCLVKTLTHRSRSF